jgi:predicted dehydrogenase
MVSFEDGPLARLHASRISPIRRRGMRALYADGLIEIDFITRQVKNTTGRPLNQLQLDDPLGESIAAFVEAARQGAASLVRPEEARRALETALLIDEAAALPMLDLRIPGEVALYA